MTDSDACDALAESLSTARLHFLQVELEVGRTMLDAADLARDDADRERRRARAQEAQWAELTTGLAALARRLDGRS